MKCISYTERGNGSGTVIFGEAPPTFWVVNNSAKRLIDNYKEMPAFPYIWDVHTVYTLLMETKEPKN